MTKEKLKFEVTDLKALADSNPNMVKFVANKKAIRTALNLGFELAGVEIKKAS